MPHARWAATAAVVFGVVFVSQLFGASLLLAYEEVPISTATNRQVEPAIAFSGERSLILWFDERDGWNAHGAFMSDGALDEPSDFIVSEASGSQSNPTLAWAGEHFMTLWDDGRSGRYTQLYVARVSQEGDVLDPEGIFFSEGPHHQNHPQIAWGEDTGLIVFQDYRAGSWDIYAARITADGANLDPEGIPVATSDSSLWYPTVAWGDGQWLVTWQDTRGSYYDILAARVSPDGAVIDGEPIPVSTEMPKYQYNPSVAYGGGVFLVVWDDGVNIWSRRVGGDGALIDGREQLICDAYGYQDEAAVAYGGGVFLVAWSDGRDSSEPDLSVARVHPVDGVLDYNGVRVSSSTGYQFEPKIAFTSNGFDVVWTDTRSGTYGHDIYAAVVDPEDIDADGHRNDADVCPQEADASQSDFDGDGYGDACDVCPDVADPDQLDSDLDGTGDACELGCSAKLTPAAHGGFGALLIFAGGFRRRRSQTS